METRSRLILGQQQHRLGLPHRIETLYRKCKHSTTRGREVETRVQGHFLAESARLDPTGFGVSCPAACTLPHHPTLAHITA
jgi:hypothetical protein